MLDTFYPYINILLRALSALDAPPDGTWVVATAQECNVRIDELWGIFDDLWWVLRTKTEERAHDIVLHVAETYVAPDQRNLRGPVVWYQLERECGGLTLDRRFELSRKAAHPSAVQAWKDVPDALRAWERDLAQWQHVSNNTMDSVTRMQTFCSMLPSDLQERVTSQLSLNTLTYPALREFVLAQVARRANDTNKKKVAEPAPAE